MKVESKSTQSSPLEKKITPLKTQTKLPSCIPDITELPENLPARLGSLSIGDKVGHFEIILYKCPFSSFRNYYDKNKNHV